MTWSDKILDLIEVVSRDIWRGQKRSLVASMWELATVRENGLVIQLKAASDAQSKAGGRQQSYIVVHLLP